MLEEIIAGGAAALGISLPENALRLYRSYFDELIRANRAFNLTAIEREEDAARLHFLDSIAALGAADFKGKTVIDVGTGGGLPGLAMKIAEPTMSLTLLDATEKKVAFLASLTQKLGVPCECVSGRAEELGHEDRYREGCDIAVARAVADMRVLAELCLPLVRPGGLFVALKASDCGAELDAAGTALAAMGGQIVRVFEYTIPGTDIVRRAVAVRKTAPTPERFPRRWAAIVKRPIY